MTTLLALDFGGPLMLLFGIIAAAGAGAAAGYVLGNAMGRTQAATPLPTTLRLTRESLAAAATRLDKASAKLNDARQAELAGNAIVIGRRVSDISSELGRIERSASHGREVST